MKLKSLTQSKGERYVKAILEDRLAKTPYQVWGKVRLGSAIGKEPGEHLTCPESTGFTSRGTSLRRSASSNC